MKFIIRKEDLYNGIKIVEGATSQKAVQPVLYNIFIETFRKQFNQLNSDRFSFNSNYNC